MFAATLCFIGSEKNVNLDGFRKGFLSTISGFSNQDKDAMDFSLGKWTLVHHSLDASSTGIWILRVFNGFGMVLPDLDNVLLMDLDLAFGGFGYFVLSDTKMQNSKRPAKLIRL